MDKEFKKLKSLKETILKRHEKILNCIGILIFRMKYF